MRYLIGHNTALDYWRKNDLIVDSSSRSCRSFADPPFAGLLQLPALSSFMTYPIHLVVTDKAARRRIEGIACHLSSSGLPPHSHIPIGDPFHLSTPEAAFHQAASAMDLITLIVIGYELCGTYTELPNGNRALAPRMTCGSLQRYLDQASGIAGVKKAQRALVHMLDRSASPMETRLALLLSLPVLLGGYGLPQPELNYPITGDDATMHVDLYWHSARFALEYDSNLHHAGAEKLNSDSIRRTQIENASAHVLSVSWDQIRDARLFDALAHTVAARIGYRIRTTRDDSMIRRYRLRRQLFPG